MGVTALDKLRQLGEEELDTLDAMDDEVDALWTAMGTLRPGGDTKPSARRASQSGETWKHF